MNDQPEIITCTICGKELTGGLDTYGLVGQELCAKHFYEIPNQAAIERVEAEIDELEREIDSHEEDLRHLEHLLADAHEELDKLSGINFEPPHKVLLVIRNEAS